MKIFLLTIWIHRQQINMNIPILTALRFWEGTAKAICCKPENVLFTTQCPETYCTPRMACKTVTSYNDVYVCLCDSLVCSVVVLYPLCSLPLLLCLLINQSVFSCSAACAAVQLDISVCIWSVFLSDLENQNVCTKRNVFSHIHACTLPILFLSACPPVIFWNKHNVWKPLKKRT